MKLKDIKDAMMTAIVTNRKVQSEMHSMSLKTLTTKKNFDSFFVYCIRKGWNFFQGNISCINFLFKIIALAKINPREIFSDEYSLKFIHAKFFKIVIR